MADRTHFLRLPGEIRNQIYEYVVGDITTLRINKQGLLVPYALAPVCRQVYKEVQESGFLGHSLKTRTSIQLVEAHVTDCDFGHVAKFLDAVAKHGFTKVEEIKIHLKLTGADITAEAVRQWIDRIGIDSNILNFQNATKRPYTLDIGGKRREPTEIAYNVEATHMSDRNCACNKLLDTVKDLLAGRYGTHQYSASLELCNEVIKSHVVMRKERKQAEANRRLQRYIRYSEERNGYRGRFWLERIRQAHFNGQNMSTLQHTVRHPKHLQQILFYSIGAWAVKGKEMTTSGGKNMIDDDDDDSDDTLDSEAFTYLKPDGNGSKPSGRLDPMSLRGWCANLRERGKPWNVRK